MVTLYVCRHPKIAPTCAICVRDGNLWEISRSPYDGDIPSCLKTFAKVFRRQNAESFADYQERTMPLFTIIVREARRVRSQKERWAVAERMVRVLTSVNVSSCHLSVISE